MTDIPALIYRLEHRADLFEMHDDNDDEITANLMREAGAELARLERERDALRAALEPLALLELPKNPQGNAGLYSIFHKQILAARAALEAKPQ